MLDGVGVGIIELLNKISYFWQETNLGNFVADSVRRVAGSDVAIYMEVRDKAAP